MQVSKVLVVDGDRATRDALVTCLQFIGVDAHGAECANSAQFWLARDAADVIVLSEELGGGLAQIFDPGLASASVLVLTRNGAASRPQANYRIDATMRRPVPVSRVVERVESMIDQRRMQSSVRLAFGALQLDLASGRVENGDHKLTLGRTEARLLAFFFGMPDRVFSRAQLLQRLWPANVRVEERTVDVHIRRLRFSLDVLGCANYIQTVRGSGYRFSRQLD